MIDFHTHILPHLDDGAKNTDMAAEMLEALHQQGVKTVIFTPHYYGKRMSPESFIKHRNAMFEHIKAKIPDGLETRLGAEMHFTGINMPDSEELCKLAIEGTSCILVELPFTEAWTGGLLEKLSEFIHDTGYTPIIAHVERYREVQKNPSLVSNLMDMGCLIQVNASAFLDKRTKKFVFALLNHGLVHCLGTDTHDAEDRAPDYAQAKQALERAGFGQKFEQIQENMRCILENQALELPAHTRMKKILGWYL